MAERQRRAQTEIMMRAPTPFDADKRQFLNQLDDDVTRAGCEQFGQVLPLAFPLTIGF